MIYVLLLSTTTIFQTWAVDKNETISATCKNDSLSNERCYLPEIISMIDPTHTLVLVFSCIHSLLSAFTLYFFISEVTQVIYNWRQWSRSKEDKMDFFLVPQTVHLKAFLYYNCTFFSYRFFKMCCAVKVGISWKVFSILLHPQKKDPNH